MFVKKIYMNIILAESSHFSVVFPFLCVKWKYLFLTGLDLSFILGKNNNPIHYADDTHTQKQGH